MSFASDFDVKERVRAAVNIVDVIGQQLQLRRQGRGYVALCPWHDDRRPSMNVNEERQTWRCWVCNIGGDVFSYVMRRDGIGFPEALQYLAEFAGIPITELQGHKVATPGSSDDKGTLIAAMRWAVDQFYDCLRSAPEAEVAREYMESRGIDDASRQLFRLGYAPESWDWLCARAKQAGYSEEILHACGLVVPRKATPGKSSAGHYDMFRDRLMFPIFDLQGRPISVGGRVLPGGEDKGGKYINGPETRLFSKSRQLYGLNFARDSIVRQGRVLVMEGYTDVIAARQAGIEPVVAVLGTALGETHIQILKRFAETVVLVLDGDAAGQRRADEVLELFVRANVDLRVLTLPDNQDPADFIRQSGAEAFLDLVENAPDAIDHKLQRLCQGIDLSHDTHQAAKGLETMLGILAQSPVAVGDLRLQQTLVRLSRTFSVSPHHLEQHLVELRQQRQRQMRPRAVVQNAPPAGGDEAESQSGLNVGEPTSDIRPQQATDRILGLDRELFEVLIERPDFVGMAVEVVDEGWLSSDSARELLRAYQQLELQGLSVDVRDCILTIENESLKSQLVGMDERVQEKAPSANQSPELRFESILNHYRNNEHRAETERRLSQLDQGMVPEDQATELLAELFAAQRVRHGVVGATNRREDG